MAQFERVEFPEINRTSIHITDDDSHTAQLSPQQALELLQWLYERQDDLQVLVQPPTQPLQPLNVEPTYKCLHQGCTNRVTNVQKGFCDMHADERNKRYDQY